MELRCLVVVMLVLGCPGLLGVEGGQRPWGMVRVKECGMVNV